MWPFKRKSHSVGVFHVRPATDDSEPYFVAACVCGWYGGFHANENPAWGDAREHAPDNVEPQVQLRTG